MMRSGDWWLLLVLTLWVTAVSVAGSLDGSLSVGQWIFRLVVILGVASAAMKIHDRKFVYRGEP